MKNLTEIEWLKYAVTKIPDGFVDMYWKKSGSLKIAFAILTAFFFGIIAKDRLYGFQFSDGYERTFNIIPYLMKSVVLFLMWTVGNWAVCTLLDGIGTIRNIFIYSTYAILPYVIHIYVNIILSHILVREEYIFMELTEFVGTVWSVILIISAIKTVHDYTVKKTFTAIFLTLIMMLIMFVILILFLLLIQQINIFISQIFTEIIYRLRD
ncbi:MAG: YIP1 family protein [Ruminococcus sp.]|nr:YIP1 family protein [Ruminococcus sp.]